MIDHPELPSFKPQVRIKLKGQNDPYPKVLPFIDDEFAYLYASTSDKSYLEDPLKNRAWKSGKIKSPEIWWISYIKKGYHANFEKVKELCNNEVPEQVSALYHPVWQLRLVLGFPVDKLIEDGKFQWSFYWFKKTGKYKSTQVNYVN